MFHSRIWTNKLRALVTVAGLSLLCAQMSFSQMEDDDVPELTLQIVSPRVSRLSWKRVAQVECEYNVGYSVFRDTDENFTPSLSNRIVGGLSKTTFLATEPDASKDYYYHVRAVKEPARCSPRSGEITIYPLDLGQTYAVSVGTITGNCTSQSTSEITCLGLPDFHAAIAAQGTHEYLIGCRSADYEDGNWTCVNLTSGVYRVGVHSQSLTIWNSGMTKINVKTGKTVSSITPVFSVLARVK